MKLHELINAIQNRLGKRVTFHECVSIGQPTVEFSWGPHRYFAVGNGRIRVLEMTSPGFSESTAHSKWMQGVLNGGVRDDSGLVEV